MKKISVISVFFLLALAYPVATTASLTIEITKGVDNPTKIGISPITQDGAILPEDIGDIIEENLRRSGLFGPIPRKDMLSFPRSVKEVYARDWLILGVEYLLVGNALLHNGVYQITFSLIEVHSSRVAFTKVAKGSIGQLRDLAHHISDEVYLAVTGIPGAFSTRIAYVTAVALNGKTRFKLMVADADGAREKLLLESNHPIMSPSWSPDAKELVYVSFETGRPAIFRQKLSNANREQLTNFKGLNGAPSWSPDGRKLALVLSKDGNPEIYTFDLRSHKFARHTNHFAIDTEPCWSPDSKFLIFTSDRGGSPQVYKLELKTGKVNRLTFHGAYNARPRLAADGRTLVMIHKSEKQFHIATQDLVTGDLRVLTNTSLDESPTVAPNSAMLLYATKKNNKGVLAAVSLDAGVKFFLPSRQGDVREPAWSPK
ncbi:MAG: Tol-Pal system beta propeller repeat protein TolB [Porticoccus sp.]|uniref:Tol-Pal system beta propeller repeat protein TolB n=1 Tax=Porticoccus sp. Uisw_050_02 TaxID=3230978 RepID=UPI0030A2290B